MNGAASIPCVLDPTGIHDSICQDMSRSARVFDLLDLLRSGQELTARDIAAQLGTSERNVFRDLALLRERGLPITGESGPGGGLRLERERGMAAVHLSDDEVVALWLSAHLSRVATQLPWGSAARSGLDKLFSSLPRKRGRELRALCRRVRVGNAASATVRAGAGQPPADLLGAFERAFTQGVCMTFDYRDRNGTSSRRRIEPHGLLVEPPVWYILSYDLDRAAARTFRMDRIARPTLMPQQSFRPRDEIIAQQTTHL